jgi:hypothetical protein
MKTIAWRKPGVRTYLLVAVAAAATGAITFVPPIPQDPGYHLFADSRSFLSVPNFWNVASNLPFVLVGAAGLMFIRRSDRRGISAALRLAHIVFFAGVLLTGFGSAWYHIAPDNRTLVWDRLPMTLAFMGLFTIVIGEHISERAARGLLLPLLAAGAASVLYWALSETRGSGDLRPYVLVQFLPVILIPLILLMWRSQFDRTAFIWCAVVAYAASKLFEHYDHGIFRLGGIVSGHSLKHVVAALAPLMLLYGFSTRRPAARRSSEVHRAESV